MLAWPVTQPIGVEFSVLGEVTAAVGRAAAADAACDVEVAWRNSRRAPAANAHTAGAAAGVVGEPPVVGAVAAAAVMRGTGEGLTVAVAAGAAVRLADDGRCARLWDAEADVLCTDDPASPVASAQATAVPEAIAAPTPNATASAPNRPMCAAAFIEGLIDFTPVGSFSDLTVPNRQTTCVTLVTCVANIGTVRR